MNEQSTHIPELADAVPLCVALDGVLIRTDLLHEAIIRFIKASPLSILQLLLWWLKGAAHVRAQLARHGGPSVECLPFRLDVIEFLRSQKSNGRQIHLVTESPQAWANAIASHLDVFDEVTGGDALNARGTTRAQFLLARYGAGKYDDIGGSGADRDAWASARLAHVAGPGARARAAGFSAEVRGEIFDANEKPVLRSLWKAARPHQWSKNLLLFVPIVAALELFQVPVLASVLLAFVSFSLIASATYMVNDLLDIDSDRAHPRKKKRPFASGDLSISNAVLAIMALSIAAISIAIELGIAFLAVLAIYVVVTLLYSFRLKRALLVDVITLAGLYTLRIIAGSIAAGTPISSWLLAFSMCCFVALAIAKRCAEISGTDVGNEIRIAGRGYYGSDIESLMSMGSASSFCASLVLCIYTTQPYVQNRYASPELLWLLAPLLIYVLNRILMLARRGHMDDDPIIFCIKDGITLSVLGVSALIVLAAIFIQLPIRLFVDL